MSKSTSAGSLNGSGTASGTAAAGSVEDGDLKATLLLFRHLDFCSLGDIGDLIKEFSDNLSARFNSISLRSDLKQYVTITAARLHCFDLRSRLSVYSSYTCYEHAGLFLPQVRSPAIGH